MEALLDTVMSSPVAVTAALLITIAAADLALRIWVRRRERRDRPSAAVVPGDGARWLTRTLVAIRAPLALLIWIHGLFLVSTVLTRGVATLAATPMLTSAIAWIYGAAVVVALGWLLLRVGRLLEAVLLALARRSDASWDDLLLPLAAKALRRTLPLLAIILAAPALSVTPQLADIVRNGSSLLLIGAVAAVLYELVDAAAGFVLARHSLDSTNNLRARSIHTQVLLLKKVVLTALAVFTAASMLMVFDSVRQFGASILASAGIAGIILGFAAQRSLGTLLAGFQIAITQPIRVDDVVIVEGEWGRIEDITLTYAVVRIWDQRRLIVPIGYFIERPFQNWTHTSSDLLCAVVLYVDYTLPVDVLRAELTRILSASSHWDGKVNVLQVTDAKEHTVEVRALASAADASRAWDLRCEIREQLLAFVQREYPASLPRIRASIDGVRESAGTPLYAGEG
jgi:small-conductance mechanosensitive channel